ncbi:MAG: NADH-quinone oxidoreductase subunit L [Vicinamibacteria bacterium]|nr:NADH-quinone oxidoreductase subunit L [Vicinamibacteria bacterium]
MLDDRLVTILAFLLLLLPLFGFVVLALFGDWIKKDKEENGAAWLACGVAILAFIAAAGCVLAFTQHDHHWESWKFNYRVNLYHHGMTREAIDRTFSDEDRLTLLQPFVGERGDVPIVVSLIDVAGLRVPFALLIDRLTVVMLLVVSGIGALIHVYSIGYMAHDPERVRFFSYLNLFLFFMLLLITAGSLPLVFVGWEGVGLCSYLLIGFWYKRDSAAAAGKKAFIVNRIGDAGLVLGMILAFHAFGSLELTTIISQASRHAPEALGEFGILTAIALLLFWGACGKSAQIPLHVWLPDAMEGPTPVSALIHAATMVTAGVYLLARLSPLYQASATASLVVAAVGLATALMAATIALVQTDIKKVLAYSTISQLGFMFLACGLGAFSAAIFHLFTHAFFKALLFLGAGSVIHALGGQQDIRAMGGLRKRLPWTHVTFLIGTLAIAGLWPLAGFFSKDEILIGTYAAGHGGFFVFALLAALLTAFYMARLLCLTFFGNYRGDHETEHHMHESPWVMLAPLLVLAAGSISVGWLNVPAYLAPIFEVGKKTVGAHGVTGHPGWIPFLALAIGLFGIAGAAYIYIVNTSVLQRMANRFLTARRVLAAGYGFDAFFDFIARRAVVDGGRRFAWARVDALWIDGTINGLARVVTGLGERVRPIQTGLVRGYALVMLGGAVLLFTYLLWVR